MKKFTELLEKLNVKNLNVSIHTIKDPIIGKTAYDYYGEPWEIIDFCKLDDNGNLQKLIKKYDSNGAFKDFMDEFSPEETYYLYDLCKYEDITYECIEAITTPGPWDSSKWSALN